MTRRTRRLLLLGLAIGMAGIAVAVALWLLRSPVNRDNFAKIEEGMALAEVEALLGGPGQRILVRTGDTGRGILHGRTWRRWEAGDVVITLSFDADDNVVGKSIDEWRTSSLDRLRRWLGL
jgi:hypothetical protein